MTLELVAPDSVAKKIEYTCPMHPQIVRNEPGNCPICGMALEPRAISADAEANPELRDMRRRFWISLALTLPVFVSAMSAHLPGNPLHQLAPGRFWTWFEMILASPVVLWADGHSLSGRGSRSQTEARTCSRSWDWASACPIRTVWLRLFSRIYSRLHFAIRWEEWPYTLKPPL